MKITGDRVRVQKYNCYGSLLWDIPADQRAGTHKYIVEYDDRPSGKIYHAGGKCYRTRQNAIKAAING